MGSEGRKDASHPGSESLLLHRQFLMNPKQRNEGKCEYLCRKSSFDGAGPASLFLLLDHAVWPYKPYQNQHWAPWFPLRWSDPGSPTTDFGALDCVVGTNPWCPSCPGRYSNGWPTVLSYCSNVPRSFALWCFNLTSKVFGYFLQISINYSHFSV